MLPLNNTVTDFQKISSFSIITLFLRLHIQQCVDKTISKWQVLILTTMDIIKGVHKNGLQAMAQVVQPSHSGKAENLVVVQYMRLDVSADPIWSRVPGSPGEMLIFRLH